jgi:predicted transcriptional regulator
MAAPLGELEQEVMTLAWKRGAVTVKDVLAALERDRAYNTVQTTLDRLFKKGLLEREKVSHSFVYRPHMTRIEFHRALIANLVGELQPKERAPVLAAFVDAAGDADLDRLEQLIEAKRAAKRKP